VHPCLKVNTASLETSGQALCPLDTRVGLGLEHTRAVCYLEKLLSLHAQPPARLHSLSKAKLADSCRLLLFINRLKRNMKFLIELSIRGAWGDL